MRRNGEKDPLILEVKGNSFDDGPGIRTVVFFKGCPLSCAWCHNPESKRRGAEIAFDLSQCVGCGTCLEVCERGALDRSYPFFVDRSLCDLCFRCVDECPAAALTRVGRHMEVGEILDLVRRDIPFFRTSGGGVTLSGGEPTLYMPYASRLLRELKAMDVHTLVETCGYFDLAEFEELIYPYADLIYYDIKLYDPDEHREHCGVSNELILDNFKALQSRSNDGGISVLARVPLIPGFTLGEDNLASIAAFLRDCGVGRVALLPYNPLWFDKSRKIGEDSPLKSHPAASTWMKREEIARCELLFEGFELL